MNYDANTLVAAIVNQAVAFKWAADFQDALTLAKQLNEQLEKTRGELNDAKDRFAAEVETLRAQVDALTHKAGV